MVDRGMRTVRAVNCERGERGGEVGEGEEKETEVDERLEEADEIGRDDVSNTVRRRSRLAAGDMAAALLTWCREISNEGLEKTANESAPIATRPTR